MIERQELWCHNCDNYVQFDLDLSLNGDYKLLCPNCGHDHYRVVKDGKITDVRYDQSPSQKDNTWTLVTYCTSTPTSTYSTYGSKGATSYFTYLAWMNSCASS